MAKNLVFVVSLCTLASFAFAEDLYMNKYDYINGDEVLSNDRIRNNYYKCFVDEAPCLTPDAKFFKEILPEAMITKCRRCTDKQRILLDKLITYYTEKEPDNWKKLLELTIQRYQKKST